MMPMRKAVSPLIGGVLIVVFTLAIGGIVSIFLRDVVNQQTQEISENSKTGCRYATADIDDIAWDNTTIPPTLRFTIASTGTKNLKIEDIRIIYTPNSSLASVLANFTETTLVAGDEVAVRITKDASNANIDYRIERVRLITDCPSNVIEAERSEISIVN